jgi:hypothetical protein
MSAAVPIGIPHPSAIAVTTDDPVLRANSLVEENHPGMMEKHPEIRERTWGLAARTDPTVTFEEYRHWAAIEREIEVEENKKYREMRGPFSVAGLVKDRFSKGAHHETEKHNAKNGTDDKNPGAVISASSSTEEMMRVTDAEWRQAARALRTAGWGTIFYLVTTDILGWSSAP